MADFDLLGDGLRKVLLAGIGALATGYEKSSELVDELVKKGEITVEQGKALNTELKRKVSETVDDAKKAAAEAGDKLLPQPTPVPPTSPLTRARPSDQAHTRYAGIRVDPAFQQGRPYSDACESRRERRRTGPSTRRTRSSRPLPRRLRAYPTKRWHCSDAGTISPRATI